jgi:hypothetical protein
VFKSFQDLNDEDYRYGFERKFLGQVKLVPTWYEFYQR